MEQLILPIDGKPGLVRDVSSHAVLNTDKGALMAAKAAKRDHQNRAKRLENLEADVGQLKTQVGEIHSMLKELLGNRD